jgi:hypothetical protein
MAHNKEHTPEFVLLEEAIITILFCQIDDASAHLNPNGHHRYQNP